MEASVANGLVHHGAIMEASGADGLIGCDDGTAAWM